MKTVRPSNGAEKSLLGYGVFQVSSSKKERYLSLSGNDKRNIIHNFAKRI